MDRVKIIRLRPPLAEKLDPVEQLGAFLLERLDRKFSRRERAVVEYVERCMLTWNLTGRLTDRQTETLHVIAEELTRRMRKVQHG